MLTQDPKISFRFEAEGSSTGKKFEANITARIPTGRDVARVGLLISKHTGGQGLNGVPDILSLPVQAAAYLEVVLDNPPSWLKDSNYGLDAYVDQNVSIALYSEVSDRIDSWRRALLAPPESLSKN